MKLILVAPMYHHGAKSKVESYEYQNFYRTLTEMPEIELSVFDYMEVIEEKGREAMNRMLLDTAKGERPNLVLVIPFTDQLIPEVIDEINQYAPTVGYFYDDMWRIEYARFWARHFRFITTSDVNGVRKFRTAGHTNVIFSPFASNQHAYYKKDVPKKYDVSFVGQYHPLRAWYIREIRRAGFNVHVWGAGWRTGQLDHDKMVGVFNQTKLNLNLSNSVSWDLRYLLSSPRAIKNTLGAALQKGRKTHEQVKGRHFEINACGSCQLSFYVEGLEQCYKIGDEIDVYSSPAELVDKIDYYLKHEDEREEIAKRGYERTLAEHTMEKRLRAILKVAAS
jgi:spore maturation protein CgeB